MLVLTRKEREDIIIADEITLFVDGISDRDGNRLSGARVRLGFECPDHISIDRGELRRRGQGRGHGRGGRGPAPEPPPPGRAHEFSDGQVHLSIHVPPMVPVCLNGKPSSAPPANGNPQDRGPATVRHCIVCRPGDRLTICNNIVIEPISFRRFEFYDAPAVGS